MVPQVGITSGSIVALLALALTGFFAGSQGVEATEIAPLSIVTLDGLIVSSPTTSSPAVVAPGDTVTVVCELTVSDTKHAVRLEVSISGLTETPEVFSVTPADWTEVDEGHKVLYRFATTVVIGVPGDTTPGTYELQVAGRQPDNPGSLQSNVTVDDAIVVTKAEAEVTLSGLEQVYDGSPKSATVTTDPAGLSVVVTYNGSATPPINAGTCGNCYL